MYRWFVRRRIATNFARLTEADYAAVVAQLAPDVHHVFAGDSALGGERHGRDAVERWFARLFRLCPSMTFDIQRVIVSGPPWDIWAAAEWIGRVRPAAGDPYVNVGLHVFRIRNGRVAYFHAYEDSQVVDRACRQMVEAGITEAGARPILD